jgi:hypothetical protein
LFGARLIVFLLSKSRTFRCQIQPDYIAKSTLKFWETTIQDGKVSPHPVWEFATDSVVKNRILL